MTVVQGSVTDPRGKLVAEASVYVVSAPTPMPDIAQLTNEQGQFTLAVPVPGHYTVGVRSNEGASTQTDFEVHEEEMITIKLRLGS